MQSSSKPVTSQKPAGVDWDSIPYADELDFTWEDYKDGVKIVRYLGKDTIVKIPETIDGKPVVKLGSNSFGGVYNGWHDELLAYRFQGVKIPKTVNAIGGMCFANCESLKTVDIPEGVTAIYINAFESCGSLRNMTIPDSVVSVNQSDPDYDQKYNPSGIFNSSGIRTIVYRGKTYDKNHISAFYDDVNLAATGGLEIQNGILTKVSTSLKTVVIPSGVVAVNANAFSGCKELTSVTFPDTLTSVGHNHTGYGNGYVFIGCENLKSLTLPDSLTNLDIRTFEDSSAAVKYSVDEVTFKGKTYKSHQFPNLFKAVNGE